MKLLAKKKQEEEKRRLILAQIKQMKKSIKG